MSSAKTLGVLATLTASLALATAPPVFAPGGTGYRVLRPAVAVPSDSYLDLGASPVLFDEPGYASPAHPWQGEAPSPAGEGVGDETLYFDVGALSLRNGGSR